MKPPPSEEKLDSLLNALAQKTPPPTPAGLAAAVWREVRRRRESEEGWLGVFARYFERREIAFAALVMTAAIGFSAGRLGRDAQLDSRIARQALHFEVFAPDAPQRPASLINYHP